MYCVIVTDCLLHRRAVWCYIIFCHKNNLCLQLLLKKGTSHDVMNVFSVKQKQSDPLIQELQKLG